MTMADRNEERQPNHWQSSETETDGSDEEGAAADARNGKHRSSNPHPHSESSGDERTESPNPTATHNSHENQETSGADSPGGTTQAETETEDGPPGLSDLEADVQRTCHTAENVARKFASMSIPDTDATPFTTTPTFKPSAKGGGTKAKAPGVKPKPTSSSSKGAKTSSETKTSKTKKTSKAETFTSYANTKVINISNTNNVVFGKQQNLIVGIPWVQPQPQPYPSQPPPRQPQQFHVPHDITSSTRRVSQDDILLVSTRIGTSWMMLARHLLPGDPRQVEVELQNIRGTYDNLDERAYQMLLMWLQRVPRGTVGDLASALVRIEMNGIAVLLSPN